MIRAHPQCRNWCDRVMPLFIDHEYRHAFDVINRHGSHFLANRRLFAMADTGKWIHISS